MTGAEMMINAAVKALGLNPDEIKKSIAGMAQLVQDIDRRLSALENGQRAIAAKLGVENGEQHPIGNNGTGTAPVAGS